MSWRDLGKLINSLSDEQKDCDVVIYDASADEYISCDKFRVADTTDILDYNNPYLEIP